MDLEVVILIVQRREKRELVVQLVAGTRTRLFEMPHAVFFERMLLDGFLFLLVGMDMERGATTRKSQRCRTADRPQKDDQEKGSDELSEFHGSVSAFKRCYSIKLFS